MITHLGVGCFLRSRRLIVSISYTTIWKKLSYLSLFLCFRLFSSVSPSLRESPWWEKCCETDRGEKEEGSQERACFGVVSGWKEGGVKGVKITKNLERREESRQMSVYPRTKNQFLDQSTSWTDAIPCYTYPFVFCSLLSSSYHVMYSSIYFSINSRSFPR